MTTSSRLVVATALAGAVLALPALTAQTTPALRADAPAGAVPPPWVYTINTPVPPGAKPYDWDPVTGLSRRFQPGQPGGMHTLTGLAHDRASKVAYDPSINEDCLLYTSPSPRD